MVDPGRGRLCVCIGLAAALSAVAPARAEKNYSEHNFGFRLPPAFVRFTEVSTAGGATAANRWSSAINPASAGWEQLPTTFVTAPYYSHVGFDNGTQLHVIGEAASIQTPAGTFQPILSQIRSNRAETRQGLTFDYEVDSYILQWGKRWGDLAFGAMFDYSSAGIVQSVGGLRVSDIDADSYRWRFGTLYQPAPKWLVGTVFEFGYAPSWTTLNVPVQLNQPPYYMVMHRHVTGQAYQYIVRPGVSYEYAPRSTVYLDYQWGQFVIGDESMGDHFFVTGIEHSLLPWLFARAGAGIDVRGNAYWTVGLSAHLSRNCSVDVGYLNDTLPELHHEFGRSQTIQAVVSFRF